MIVIHDLDDPPGRGAQWGEVQANIHKALGCAGVVTDGSVRDLDEVRALGFQFCAARVSVSHAWVHMVDFGLPVKVGGLWVKPGDLLHGDQHGVVAIPHEIAPKIPEGVAKVEAAERRIITACQAADFSAEKLRASTGKSGPTRTDEPCEMVSSASRSKRTRTSMTTSSIRSRAQHLR